LEELALNALPCLQMIHYDGWVLRFADGAGGYPRRANSIQMLYPSTLPLDEKIDFCQAQYAARGFKTVFKMTPAAPDGLEAALKARGYLVDCPTSVQTLDLAGIDPQPDSSLDLICEPSLSAEWAAENARLHGENPARAAVINVILERLSIQSVFLRLCRNGETVALGRGALDSFAAPEGYQGYVGPYEIITDPRFRQQGLGRQMMLHVLKWG
jgi:hypothetical protein